MITKSKETDIINIIDIIDINDRVQQFYAL